MYPAKCTNIPLHLLLSCSSLSFSFIDPSSASSSLKKQICTITALCFLKSYQMVSGQQAHSQSFSLFPYLPTELRLQIWQLSCAHRVITMVYDAAADRYKNSTAPPAILHVNRESRVEGQRLYKRVPFSVTNPWVYLCPELDTLYIPRHDRMGYSAAAREIGHYLPFVPPLVRRLAIDHVDPVDRKPWETYSKYCLIKSFPNLEEAYLIVTPPHEKQTQEPEGHIEFVNPDAEPEAIIQLMEDVRESFTYEIGPGVMGFEKDRDVMRRGENGDVVMDCLAHPSLLLVPKAKVTGKGQHSQGAKVNTS